MSRHYHSFEIKLLDEKFEGSDIHTPRSAQVKFFNRAGRVLHVEVYGIPEKQDLVNFYRSNQRLSLNNLYLRNFSLPEILHAAGQGLTVHEFSAVNTFFDSDDLTDFSNIIFSGNVDFINAHFAYGNTSFYKAVFKAGDVDFGNVNFGNGDVNYQFVEFGNGTINFENAIFGDGEILFVNTHFGTGKVSFKNVNFGTGEVDFHFSKFEKGDISFDKAVFGGPKVDFRRVEFGDGKLDFTRTDFGNGEVNFEETEYGKGRKNFKRAIFGKAHVSFELAHFGENEVTFENAEFDEGKLSFFKASAGSIVLSHCQLNNYLDLRVEKCTLIDLSNTIVKDIIDIKPGFSKVEVGQLNITGMRNLGKIFIDWEENHVHTLVASQQDTSFAQKADQFRILKEDFNTSGRYDDEDRAYVEFKRYELRSYKELALKEGKKSKVLVHLRVFFQRLIFDRMGLYATNPARVLASMFMVYLGFSMIYFVMHSAGWGQIETGLNNPEPLSYITMSLYYSAVTFFTIGYGDYFPYGAIRWVACIEGFCGVFMMSYFVVAFVRKILR